MKFRKLIPILLLCIFISACGSNDKKNKKNDDKNTTSVIEATNKNDYQTVAPFEAVDSRQTHVDFNRGVFDRNAVGKGLINSSKKHFSVDDYALQEGSILDRDALQVGAYIGDDTGLLGFKSDTNTIGLNPENGSILPTGSGDITTGTDVQNGKGTIPIVDIFEIDFIKKSDISDNKKDISGISVAIVLNNKVKDASGAEHTLKDEALINLGSESARHLIAYLRKQPQVSQSTPIYVMLFKADSSDSNLPGSFIAEGYGTDSINSFDAIKEEWCIFPSTQAQKLDSVSHAQFESIRSALYEFIPNDIGVVGKGRFTNDKLDYFQITITTQIKTYTESTAVLQYVNSLLANIKSEEVEILVEISSDNETYALIKREIGSSSTTVIKK